MQRLLIGIKDAKDVDGEGGVIDGKGDQDANADEVDHLAPI